MLNFLISRLLWGVPLKKSTFWNGYMGVSEWRNILPWFKLNSYWWKCKPSVYFFVMSCAHLPIYVSGLSSFHYHFNTHGSTLHERTSARETEHFSTANQASFWRDVLSLPYFLFFFIISNVMQVAALTPLFSRFRTELVSLSCLLRSGACSLFAQSWQYQNVFTAFPVPTANSDVNHIISI